MNSRPTSAAAAPPTITNRSRHISGRYAIAMCPPIRSLRPLSGPGDLRQSDEVEVQGEPQHREQDSRDPGRGDELARQLGVHRRGRIAAAGGLDPLLPMAAHTEG